MKVWPQRKSSMVSKLKEQYYQRLNNLPEGTKQQVIIDIRGQEIDQEILDAIADKLNYYDKVEFGRE